SIASYYQILRNRLNAQVHHLIASILDSLLASPISTRCSCEQLGSCRLALITVINHDGTTYLEPGFPNCDCPPVWRNFHQRQLYLVNADLKDLHVRMVQLNALENGVQELLLRHRELANKELRKEQYWLCQDYARTDRIRWLHNLDIRKRKQRRRFGIIVSRDEALNTENCSVDPDREEELPVEEDDLDMDEEIYEFPLCVSEKSDLEVLPSRKDAASDSPTGDANESRPSLKTTLNGIRRGQYLTLEEVLDRFEDFKHRAYTLIHKWDDEDEARASRVDT
ncbi:MAG: hypothetical protein Q9169_008577, partial [Polycauliona sp. 2 TL-2023]